MSKILLTAFVIAAAISIWSMLRKANKSPASKKGPSAPPRLRQMVRCTVCGAQVDEQLTLNHGRGPECLEHSQQSHKAKP